MQCRDRRRLQAMHKMYAFWQQANSNSKSNLNTKTHYANEILKFKGPNYIIDISMCNKIG